MTYIFPKNSPPTTMKNPMEEQSKVEAHPLPSSPYLRNVCSGKMAVVVEVVRRNANRWSYKRIRRTIGANF